MARDVVADAIGRDNVVENSGAEAQEILENKKTPFTGMPNRFNEKHTSGSVLLSV